MKKTYTPEIWLTQYQKKKVCTGEKVKYKAGIYLKGVRNGNRVLVYFSDKKGNITTPDYMTSIYWPEWKRKGLKKPGHFVCRAEDQYK